MFKCLSFGVKEKISAGKERSELLWIHRYFRLFMPSNVATSKLDIALSFMDISVTDLRSLKTPADRDVMLLCCINRTVSDVKPSQ